MLLRSAACCFLIWQTCIFWQAPTPGHAAEPQHVDVFVPQQDGFASIRIPSVVVLPSGTVLAMAEGRAADADQAQNKLILKRSHDHGMTWDKAIVIASAKDQALNNPCAVVDHQRKNVLVMYQSYPSGISERSNQIKTGYEGEAIVRSWLITSYDEGLTWSAPRDVTRETKRPERVTTIAGGPGIGIQLQRGQHAGRLVMPFNEGPFSAWNIYAVYSDDGGNHWQRGEVAPGALVSQANGKLSSLVNEAQVVELSDGAVRFNVRRWSGTATRKTSVSHDGGKTWSEISDVPELSDPSCMASVLRYDFPQGDRPGRMLFSGPQSQQRNNGTICLSTNDGAAWPIKRVLVSGDFAYSCLTRLNDGAVGCLYEAEGTRKIKFARFELDWITGDDTVSADGSSASSANEPSSGPSNEPAQEVQ